MSTSVAEALRSSSCSNHTGLPSASLASTAMAEWKVRTHCLAWPASKGYGQKPRTLSSCSRSCAQEALVKEITVRLSGLMPM
ncbi:hypothetical protein D3C78_1153370 [compost metagenome]